MKNFLFIITFLATLMAVIPAIAQDEVETPVLTSVTVNNEGVPVVSWSMQHPDLVDGYIIKRLIVDGQGVIPGTYNNVAVVEDSHTFSYTDNSTEYGTHAMTYVRPEYYCVAAYIIDPNGQKHYSLMSEPVATIKADGQYDPCDNSYNFQYSGAEGGGRFEVIQISPDSLIYTYFDDFCAKRDFRIYWFGNDGVKTSSPIITIEAQAPVPPDNTAIEYVTINDANQIALSLTATESKSSSQARLLRCTVLSNITTEIPLRDSVMHGTAYTDANASPDSIYSYKLAIYDSCGHLLSESAPVQNIVATVTEDSQNINLIQWNSNQTSDGSIASTAIFRRIGNGEWEQVSEVSGFYGEYQDRLPNIIGDDNMYDGKFCYYIQATTLKGYQIRSNTVCLQREPVIYIPNAFNPNSDIQDNRTFRPRASFLADYHLAIYDKRGALLFQSDDINEGWDGYDRTSKLCHRDTYIYYISYTNSFGKKVNQSGKVNLLY